MVSVETPNGNGARAQATVSAIIKWVAGVCAVFFVGTVGWNLTHVIDYGQKISTLEIAESKDFDMLRAGQTLRYTSNDAARDQAENNRRLDAIERRLERLDGDPVKRSTPPNDDGRHFRHQ